MAADGSTAADDAVPTFAKLLALRRAGVTMAEATPIAPIYVNFEGSASTELLCLPDEAAAASASEYIRGDLLHLAALPPTTARDAHGPGSRPLLVFNAKHDKFLTAAAFEQAFAAAAHLGALHQLVTVEAGLREADASDERTVLTALVQRRRALLRALKLAKLGALVGPPARFLRQQLEMLRMAHVLLADAVVEATIALLAGRYDELRAASSFDSLQRILPPLIYLRLLRSVPAAALDAAARGEPPRPWPRLADDRVVTGSFAALLPPTPHRGRASANAEDEELSLREALSQLEFAAGDRAAEVAARLQAAPDIQRSRAWTAGGALSPTAKEMRAALDASLAAAATVV